MGYLTSGRGSAPQDSGATDDSDAPDVEESLQSDESTQQDAGLTRNPDLEPSGDPIPVNRPSRRQRARMEIEETIKKHVSGVQESVQKTISEQSAQINQLLGTLRTLQEQRSYQQAPPPETKSGSEDIDALDRQADEALERSDYATWKKLQRKIARLEAEQVADERMKRLQGSQQPQGIPPQVMAVAINYPKVLERDPDLRLVSIKDQELDFQGVPPGPARVRKAFEAANALLGGSQSSQPSFSQGSASVLSGTPTQSSGANTPSGPRVRLTPFQKQVAKKAGLSEEEYARHLAITHPELVEK